MKKYKDFINEHYYSSQKFKIGSYAKRKKDGLISKIINVWYHVDPYTKRRSGKLEYEIDFGDGVNMYLTTKLSYLNDEDIAALKYNL